MGLKECRSCIISPSMTTSKITHVLFDASATLIYPFPSFEDFGIEFLEKKGIRVDKTAKEKANKEAEKVLTMHKKKVSAIPSSPVSERIVWSHYQSVRLKHLSTDNHDHPWLEWGYEVYDHYNPSDKWKIYHDVEEALQKVSAMGYKLVVVSDFGPGLEKILELVKIKQHFDFIFVSTIEGVSKANSELYNRVLEKIKLTPAQTMMIGDNYEMDVQLPSVLGIPAIWLNREQKQLPSSFSQHKHIVTSLLEIPAILSSTHK